MALNKSKGNMYPWVTHTHNHLGGECSHKCTYCYVDSFRARTPKYQGELRLIEKELLVNYGSGKTIFIEDCNDLFAEDVPDEFIERILSHCRVYPDNTYVFQTKNPRRFVAPHIRTMFPEKSLYGTTIETNRNIPNIGNAPPPRLRFMFMSLFDRRKFITIEPILDFDLNTLLMWMIVIRPEFINIGADSKKHDLPEPGMAKLQRFINRLKRYGFVVKEKHNLGRLLGHK